jgi:hydroxyquinol 1,2-dioxygenase
MREPDPTAATDHVAGIEEDLTRRVVESFAECDDERLKVVLTSLTRHLHAFAREVRLTQREWKIGIDFLTSVGAITDDRRQEFILLSDVLGMSMLTVAINQPAHPGVTESTVFGPFFTEGAPHVELGGDISGGAVGMPAWITGRVTDQDGNPVAGARTDVWESDDEGFYDVQYDDGRTAGRGYLISDDDGGFRFWCVRPSPYPIPDDGPVGQLLRTVGRSPMRPAHLHFMVTAPGHHRVVTHYFVAGSPHLDDDAVFGVKDNLVVPFTKHDPGAAPDGRQLDEPWCAAHVDIVLATETA